MVKNTKINCLAISRSIGIGLLAVSLLVCSLATDASAQKGGKRKSNRKAIAFYADAAGFQNNAAYKLAIEEWQKLLKDYPNDPLASKANHYLGVCYIQLEQPDYNKAAGAFAQALKDRNLEVREESLINLSWCLFNQARESKPGSADQEQGLLAAKKRLTEFLSSYSNGSYVDQALFYMGEIEYSLGNNRKSINFFKRMLDSSSLKKSSLRPDARYAIAVAYEEEEDSGQATRHYQTFLQEHPKHRFAQEVRVRLADLLLADSKAADAEKLLSHQSKGQDKMADYALLRLGYSLAQQGKTAEAAEKYLQLLNEYPDSEHAPAAALSVGQSLFEQGRYDEAVKRFQSVLAAKDAQAADAAHWIAITRLRQQKPAEVIKLLDEVLTWAGKADNAIALQMDYADALYAMPKQLEKAGAAYGLIAREHADDPLAPRAAYNAAFAALQLSKYREAREWSEFFLGRYPQDPLRNDVAYVAAESLLQQGEPKAAVKAYTTLRKADRKNPAYSLWTLRLAMAHYLSGQYKPAIDLLRTELNRFQDDQQKAEAEFILGASFLYQEDTRTAIEQLTTSHQTSDSWSSADEVLLLLAEAHQRNKDKAAAKKTLEMLLKKYPESRLKAQVDYKLAQLSAAMNQFQEAIQKYESIVANEEASNLRSFANYGIVWCLMQQEQYESALSRLKPLLRNGVQGSILGEAQLAQGVCLRKLGRIDQATDALERFLETSPKHTSLANGLYELGLARTEQGNLGKANKLFQRVIREVPSYPAMDKVLYELAWNHEEGSNHADAAKHFSDLAERFPGSEYAAEATYMIGQQQYDAEEFQQAASTYTSVLTRTDDPALLEKAQYKLGWSLFQQERYPEAATYFSKQSDSFSSGPLAVDALFMLAECSFKQDQFATAFKGYQQARANLESNQQETAASDQVKTLIFLHGAQCLREQKQWPQCQQWLEVIVNRYPDSTYIATALYELGYCKQNQNQIEQALSHYSEVANKYRNEVAARSRFMMGEVYFSQRDFAKAIPEFQRVMYGFGGDNATKEIKNWQVKSAFEAARCSEVLIENLQGSGRTKIVQTAQEFYRFIVEKHAAHDLAAQAQTRLGELRQLR